VRKTADHEHAKWVIYLAEQALHPAKLLLARMQHTCFTASGTNERIPCQGEAQKLPSAESDAQFL
jgi:hypothetical protein